MIVSSKFQHSNRTAEIKVYTLFYLYYGGAQKPQLRPKLSLVICQFIERNMI